RLMKSADGAGDNQLLFKMVQTGRNMPALQSFAAVVQNNGRRAGESPKRGSWHFFRLRWLGFAGLACLPLVGWLDHKTGPAISFSLFYVPPVARAAGFSGRG